MKKILVFMVTISFLCVMSACGNETLTSQGNSFNADELNGYQAKIDDICDIYNYNYNISKKGNGVVVYELSNEEKDIIEVTFLKWSEDDIDLTIGITNDNITEDSLNELDTQVGIAVNTINEFAKEPISKGLISTFITDESNMQKTSGDDEVLISKQYNENNIALTYQVFCQNGTMSKDYSKGDLLREVIVIIVNI